MYQKESLLELCQYCKSLGLNVWVYTGYLYEKILKDETMRKVLDYIDVLVDGPFIFSKKTQLAPYRGSSNQRVIDVIKSLNSGKIIELDLDGHDEQLDRTNLYI